MYLTQASTKKEMEIEISFEKVADDLLMVSAINQEEMDSILSYWRLIGAMDDIPPLELGINCKRGSLASITFFVDSIYMPKDNCYDINMQKGSVVLNSNIFTKTNGYVDVEKKYNFYMAGDKLICYFGEGHMFEKGYRSDRLEVYMDFNKNLVGFAICDLHIEEKNMIKQFLVF